MALETAWIAWLPTLVLLAACVAASAMPSSSWTVARTGVATALLLSVTQVGLALTDRGGAHLGPQEVFALLVAFIGWIVLRFSARYLEGEPGNRRYVTSLLATLAAIMGLAAADHLGVTLAMWVATSIGLHGLLVFYPDRTGARVA